MRTLKTTAIIAVLMALSTAIFAQKSDITINGDIPWVVSTADYENISIQMAIRDAERDWYKVFGYPPVVFKDKPSSSWNGPVIVLGSVENTKHLLDAKVPEGKEQYHLSLATLENNQAIAAVGSDTRGSIYAIYTFTQDVLGIDPMYIFTDKVPEKKSEITLAADFDIISKKPTFENRGWFINDEELHDGMHRDPLGGNVISMEWMDKILETLLRTKNNMIIPESAPYSDATVYDLCKRRSVIISHHHVTPVGLNMMDWPKGVPFSFMSHKDILVDAWTKAIKAQADKEVAWIIGFRGESDGAFWNSDPDAPTTDEGRAQVIAEAMQIQTDIIRQYQPEATIVAALWNEVGAFYNQGILEIPDGVCKMFADDGRGYMRDKGDGTDLDEGDGLYYHVMMMMNTQNRTTEGVPPARFYSELQRYVDKGATKYAIINVSGIRPAVMSVEAISDFLWDAEPALSKSPEEAMKDYLAQWYSKEFGEEVGEDLAKLRLHYYDIPYMRAKMPVQGRWKGARGEHLLHYLTQGLLDNVEFAVDKDLTLNKAEEVINKHRFVKISEAREPIAETAEFFPELWKETLAMAEKIPEDREDFYQFHFTYQVAVHMYSSRILSSTCDAYEAFGKDNNQQAFADEMKICLEDMELIINEMHKAEYGQWETMFMHVRLLDMWKTRLLLKQVIAKIEGTPYTKKYRGVMNGSFWGDAQEYVDHAEGTFPNFYKHTGPGLDVIENGVEFPSQKKVKH